MKALRDKATGRLLSWWDEHSNFVTETEEEPFAAPDYDPATHEVVDVPETDQNGFNIAVAQQIGVEPTAGVGDVFLHPDEPSLAEALDADLPRTPDRERTFTGRAVGRYLVSVNPPGEGRPDQSTMATLEAVKNAMVAAGATANSPLRLADIQNVISKGNR